MRSVKHALQTYIDGPVFGRHKFYFQVLCLEVYLVGRDGRSKVTPGTISNIPQVQSISNEALRVALPSKMEGE